MRLYSGPLVGLMAVALLFGSAGVAAHADPASNGLVSGDDTSGRSAAIAITTVVQMPLGTTTPNTTFTFLATPDAVANKPEEIPPALNSAVATGDPVVYQIPLATYDDQGTTAGTQPAPSGDFVTVSFQTADLFDGVAWPHAGIYTYTVSEQNDSAAFPTMSYSTAAYALTVYVKQSPVSSDFYVSAYSVIVESVDKDGPKVGEKVNALPGDGNGLTFTNVYIETHGPKDPGHPQPATEATLVIGNQATGDLANTTNLYFDYTIELSLPSLLADVFTEIPETLPAYILETNNGISTVLEDVTPNLGNSNLGDALAAPAESGVITVSTNPAQPTEFKLKHGQSLVFVDTPVGTGYAVTQTVKENYAVELTVTRADGKPVAIDPDSKDGSAISSGSQRVGASTARADFVNQHVTVDATGVLINTLPFVGMILLALGGLGVFIVIKSRQAKAAR